MPFFTVNVESYSDRLYLGSAEWLLTPGGNDQFRVDKAQAPGDVLIKLLILTIYYKTQDVSFYKRTKLIDIRNGTMFDYDMSIFKEIIELRTLHGSRYIMFQTNGIETLQPFRFTTLVQSSDAAARITNIKIMIYGLHH